MNHSPRSSARPRHFVRVPISEIRGIPKKKSAGIAHLYNLRVYVGALAGSAKAPKIRYTPIGRVVDTDDESILVDIGGLHGMRGPLEYRHAASGPRLIAAGVA